MKCSHCNNNEAKHNLYIIPKENILLKEKRVVCADCVPALKKIYGNRTDRFIEVENM
jgi:formate dehydrogenase maturation protein FdhE